VLIEPLAFATGTCVRVKTDEIIRLPAATRSRKEAACRLSPVPLPPRRPVPQGLTVARPDEDQSLPAHRARRRHLHDPRHRAMTRPAGTHPHRHARFRPAEGRHRTGTISRKLFTVPGRGGPGDVPRPDHRRPGRPDHQTCRPNAPHAFTNAGEAPRAAAVPVARPAGQEEFFTLVGQPVATTDRTARRRWTPRRRPRSSRSPRASRRSTRTELLPPAQPRLADRRGLQRRRGYRGVAGTRGQFPLAAGRLSGVQAAPRRAHEAAPMDREPDQHEEVHGKRPSWHWPRSDTPAIAVSW